MILTLFESLTAGIFITIVMLIMGLSLSFSLLLGAIGCATAPASTIMTIRQYKAKGPFVGHHPAGSCPGRCSVPDSLQRVRGLCPGQLLKRLCDGFADCLSGAL